MADGLAESAARLVDAADKALYQAKHQGRNRVAWDGEAERLSFADRAWCRKFVRFMLLGMQRAFSVVRR